MTTPEKLAQARARQEQAWNDLQVAAGIVLVTGARRTLIEATALRWVNSRHQTGRLEKHQRDEVAAIGRAFAAIERADQEGAP